MIQASRLPQNGKLIPSDSDKYLSGHLCGVVARVIIAKVQVLKQGVKRRSYESQGIDGESTSLVLE